MENQREIKALAAEFKTRIAQGEKVYDPWCYYFKWRISRRKFTLRHDYTSMFARLLASPELLKDMEIKYNPEENTISFLGTEHMMQDAEAGNLDVLSIIACGLPEEVLPLYARTIAKDAVGDMPGATRSQKARERYKVRQYITKIYQMYQRALAA